MSEVTLDCFNELTSRLLSNASATLQLKSQDYAPPADVLAAFKEAAAATGLDVREVWGVYFMKHVQAVMRYIRDGELASEVLESRLVDIINYVCFLNAISYAERVADFKAQASDARREVQSFQ